MGERCLKKVLARDPGLGFVNLFLDGRRLRGDLVLRRVNYGNGDLQRFRKDRGQGLVGDKKEYVYCCDILLILMLIVCF